jgi:hypothetical protein
VALRFLLVALVRRRHRDDIGTRMPPGRAERVKLDL